MTKENPWIEWNGEKCPLEAGTKIDVIRRDGREEYELTALESTNKWRDADARFWVTSDRHHSDIIAYRLVKP